MALASLCNFSVLILDLLSKGSDMATAHSEAEMVRSLLENGARESDTERYSVFLKSCLLTFKGKLSYASGDIYEGDWVDNLRNGFGRMHYKSPFLALSNCLRTGNVYDGEWRNGQRHGRGKMSWVHLHESYDGEWSEGIQVSP